MCFPLVALLAYAKKRIRVARWNRLWEGTSPAAAAPTLGLPLEDYGGFKIEIEDNNTISLRFDASGLPNEFWLNLHPTHERRSNEDDAEPIRFGVAPLDRFFRVRKADRATGQRLRLSPERLAPLARLLRRWDSRANLELAVETIRGELWNEQTSQWEHRVVSKLRLHFGDDTEGLKFKLPPPAELRGLTAELAAAARGLYAAASVPPALPAAQVSAQLDPRVQQATYWIERPVQGHEQITGLELAQRICSGLESPLVRVAPQGETEWQHVGARTELAGLFEDRPLDELAPGPKGDDVVHKVVNGTAWFVRFVFVDRKIWLTPAIFAWIAAGFFGYELFAHRRVQQSLSWTATQGQILDSEARFYKRQQCSSGTTGGPGSGGSLRPSSSRSCRTITGYESVLAYTYTVDGRTYTGDRYSVRLRQKDARERAEVAEFLRPFPEGKRVQVFYNPENPRDAVLRQGALNPVNDAWWSAMLLPAGLGVLAFFLLLALAWAWPLLLRRRPPLL